MVWAATNSPRSAARRVWHRGELTAGCVMDSRHPAVFVQALCGAVVRAWKEEVLRELPIYGRACSACNTKRPIGSNAEGC